MIFIRYREDELVFIDIVLLKYGYRRWVDFIFFLEF